MHSAFLGEFFGTMHHDIARQRGRSQRVLRQSKGEKSGWIVITAGWCFGVMAGVFVALALGSDGHLNPAVTLASPFRAEIGAELQPMYPRKSSAR